VLQRVATLRIDQRLERRQVELAVGRHDDVLDVGQAAAERRQYEAVEVLQGGLCSLRAGAPVHLGEDRIDSRVDRRRLAERDPLGRSLSLQDVGHITRLLPPLLISPRIEPAIADELDQGRAVG
jgi:hypothetical protein